jgi:hypothetical protein
MENLTLIILKTSEFEIPSNITIAANYGREIIVIDDEHTNRVSGISMAVRGTSEALREMVKLNKGVWTSNNPMFGGWNFRTV